MSSSVNDNFICFGGFDGSNDVISVQDGGAVVAGAVVFVPPGAVVFVETGFGPSVLSGGSSPPDDSGITLSELFVSGELLPFNVKYNIPTNNRNPTKFKAASFDGNMFLIFVQVDSSNLNFVIYIKKNIYIKNE
tara:strand:- start:485 stop:886 length:402 start_codon:yes stop_codon:yes gene_type:complete